MTWRLAAAAFFFASFAATAQVGADSQPKGGTTHTHDANASVGDNTSDAAESTAKARKKGRNIDKGAKETKMKSAGETQKTEAAKPETEKPETK